MQRIIVALADDQNEVGWETVVTDNLLARPYQNTLVLTYPEDRNAGLIETLCREAGVPVFPIPKNTERYSNAVAYHRRSRWVLDLLIGAREHHISTHVCMFTEFINPSDFELKDFIGYCYALEIPITQYLRNGGFVYDP